MPKPLKEALLEHAFISTAKAGNGMKREVAKPQRLPQTFYESEIPFHTIYHNFPNLCVFVDSRTAKMWHSNNTLVIGLDYNQLLMEEKTTSRVIIPVSLLLHNRDFLSRLFQLKDKNRQTFRRFS